MTVGQLREALQAFPEDAVVLMESGGLSRVAVLALSQIKAWERRRR